MKKLIVCLIITVLVCLFILTGCAAGQLDINQPAVKVVDLMKAADRDPNLTEPEKFRIQVSAATAYAKETGLITTEEETGFADAFSVLWNAFILTQPGGVPKTIWSVILLQLITNAVLLIKKKKTDGKIS